MSGNIVTPSYFVTFESNLQSLIVDRWAEFNSDSNLAYWDMLAETKTTASREELFEWQINRAKIREQIDQANRRYDDLWSWGYSISPKDYGDNIVLHEKDIEDNRVDHIGQWASDIGGYAAYFPQNALLEILAAAETQTGYDGVPFFATTHPRVPGITTGGTWSNLTAATPLSFPNFATAVANIKKILGPGNINRFLRPFRLWVPPSLEQTGLEILESKTLGDSTAAGRSGTKDNVLTRYGFEALRVMQDHPDDGSWYLQCKVLSGPFRMPFVYLVRKDWQLNTYQAASQVELNRAKKWEYNFDGRVSMNFGEPSALFKFKAS